MYCVTVDLSAINYTKGKMSYLNVNEKFICFESVYVLGRCGLNLSIRKRLLCSFAGLQWVPVGFKSQSL